MKQNFNNNWLCYKTGDREHAFAVTLPHDAMQLDERSETSAGGVNTGWYDEDEDAEEDELAEQETNQTWNGPYYTS